MENLDALHARLLASRCPCRISSLMVDRRAARHPGRRAAGPRRAERRLAAAAADLRHAAGLGDHPALEHVLGRAVRRLGDLDPVQHSGRAVLGRDHLRRLSDGARRPADARRWPPPSARPPSARWSASCSSRCSRPGSRRSRCAFGPPEYFAVYFLAFASFVGMGGAPPIKTLVSLAIGFAIAAVGIDTVSGSVRLTMGVDELVKGVSFVVAVMGLFGIGELLIAVEEELHVKAVSSQSRVARGVPHARRPAALLAGRCCAAPRSAAGWASRRAGRPRPRS